MLVHGLCSSYLILHQLFCSNFFFFFFKMFVERSCWSHWMLPYVSHGIVLLSILEATLNKTIWTAYSSWSHTMLLSQLDCVTRQVGISGVFYFNYQWIDWLIHSSFNGYYYLNNSGSVVVFASLKKTQISCCHGIFILMEENDYRDV